MGLDLAPIPVAISSCLGDRDCHRPLIVAHRGEGTGAPENSIAAILAASNNGADLAETDVRVSQDGVPVLLHDGTLNRTTNVKDIFVDRANIEGDYRLEDFTVDELAQLTLNDDEGFCTPENADDDPYRCHLPTLQNALEAAQGRALLMLDYKTAPLEAVADAILSANATDSVLFFDSDVERLDTIEDLVPGVVTMPRAEDAASTSMLIQDRDPFVVHIDPAYTAEAAIAADPGDVKLFVNGFVNIDLYLIGYDLGGDENNLDLARQETLDVLEAGADIIQTNKAPLLRQILDELGVASP